MMRYWQNISIRMSLIMLAVCSMTFGCFSKPVKLLPSDSLVVDAKEFCLKPVPDGYVCMGAGFWKEQLDVLEECRDILASETK